jgi:hypothetical protein
MRLLIVSFLLFFFLISRSEAGNPLPESRCELSDAKTSLPVSQQEKSKALKKKKVSASKAKAARKLRFTKPFMFLNPLISHLLLLSPSQQLNDTIGA